MRAAYDAAAADWAVGPERVYTPLARALIGAAPVPVAGGLVLDLGAGTGVAGRAALAAGADPGGGRRPGRGHVGRPARRNARWRPTPRPCRSAIRSLTWSWPRSASTT